MLIYADIEQLSAIAKRYQCTCSSHSKHDLIQSILSHTYREDILENQFNLMPAQQKHLLSLLLFEPNIRYSTEELKTKIKYCQFAPPFTEKTRKKKQEQVSLPLEELIIKQLKEEGWLFKEHSSSNHIVYRIPEDKSEGFRKYLGEQLNKPLRTFEQVEVVRDEAGFISEDLKQMLYYFHKNTIQLNDIQLMNKRQLQHLLDQFHVREQIPGKHAWKFGYGKKFGDYPDRFALLYQFAVNSGWLTESNIIEVTPLGLAKLEEQSEVDVIRLIEYWLKIYKKPIPNLRALSFFLLMMLNEWRSVDEIQVMLLPYIKAYYFDTQEAILHKRLLKMLLHFGVIQLGQAEHHEALLVKLSPYGKNWLMQAIKLNEQGKYIK